MFLVILVSALVLTADDDAFAIRSWGHFERSEALSHQVDTVDISTIGKTGDRFEFRLRLRSSKLRGPVITKWADSRTCPAIGEALTRLRALAPPVIVPPGFDPEPTEILVDGAGYSLTVPAADIAGQSTLTWTSNVGTPLATWINRTLKTLGPCWKQDGPSE